MDNLDGKLEGLKHFIEEKGKDGVVIAFSGGVDSSTLAAISYEVLGEKAVAVIAQSPTYTSEELRDAKKIAAEIGIKLSTWWKPTNSKTPISTRTLKTAATSAKKNSSKP